MHRRGRRQPDSGTTWGIPLSEPATVDAPAAEPGIVSGHASDDPWGPDTVSIDPFPVPPPPASAAAQGATLTIPAPPQVLTLPPPPAPPADEIRLDPPAAPWVESSAYPAAPAASPWGIPAAPDPHTAAPDAFAPVSPVRGGSVGRGLAFGAVTAVLAAALWTVVVLVSNWQLGIVAIAVGLLVAGAVRFGSGHRPGALTRGGAMALTLLAMILAHLVITRDLVLNHHAAQSGEAVAPLAEVLSGSVDSLLAQPLTVVFWVIAVFNAWWFAAPAPREPRGETAQAAG
jgi:hypothetical protein